MFLKRKEADGARRRSDTLAASVGAYWLGIADQVCPQTIPVSLEQYILALPSRALIEKEYEEQMTAVNCNSEAASSRRGACHRRLQSTRVTNVPHELFLYSISMMEMICQKQKSKKWNK